jgi:hypothetical protein
MVYWLITSTRIGLQVLESVGINFQFRDTLYGENTQFFHESSNY